MPTFAERLPATRSAARRGYTWTPASRTDSCDGTLCCTAERSATYYAVTEFPNDLHGRSFRCEKRGGESYDVFIGDSQRDDICDCRGFTRYGRCKHAESLRDLIEQGQLQSPLANCDADFASEEPEYEDSFAAIQAQIAKRKRDEQVMEECSAYVLARYGVVGYTIWLENPIPLS